MTDKDGLGDQQIEMLGRALRAAGYRVGEFHEAIQAYYLPEECIWFNSLDGLGDAMRLACRLQIRVEHSGKLTLCMARGIAVSENHDGSNDGRERATMYAITRLAAWLLDFKGERQS